MVNGSNVTVNGKLNLETGEHSWYGMNVDCKNGDSSLSFAEGSSVNFSGTTAYAAFGNQGIVVENSDSSNNNTVTVDLGQATVTSNMDSFYAVVTASGVTNTITPLLTTLCIKSQTALMSSRMILQHLWAMILI